MKKTSFHTVAVAFAVAILAGGPAAALAATPVPGSATGNLSVTGAIAPGSCSISFAGGSAFDFGTITADKLNALSTSGTALDTSAAQSLVVSCTAKTQVAIGASDLRSASVTQLASGTGGNYLSVNAVSKFDGAFGPGTNTDSWFGLGVTDAASGAKPIGAYVITADSFVVDSAPTSALAIDSSTGTATATGFNSGQATYIAQSGRLTGWSAPKAATPAPALGMQFSANLYVTPVIANTNTLPLNRVIQLDGNASFTVFYL